MNRRDCFRAKESDTIETYLIKNVVYIIKRRHQRCGHVFRVRSLNELRVPETPIAFLLSTDLLNCNNTRISNANVRGVSTLCQKDNDFYGNIIIIDHVVREGFFTLRHVGRHEMDRRSF